MSKRAIMIEWTLGGIVLLMAMLLVFNGCTVTKDKGCKPPTKKERWSW